MLHSCASAQVRLWAKSASHSQSDIRSLEVVDSRIITKCPSKTDLSPATRRRRGVATIVATAITTIIVVVIVVVIAMIAASVVVIAIAIASTITAAVVGGRRGWLRWLGPASVCRLTLI